MTIVLAVWGAALSTLLGCLTLYDRYIKHTGRVRIVIEQFSGHWELDFTRPVRRLDGDRIPKDAHGQPDVSPFDDVFCFQVINISDAPVEIRFAEIFLRIGRRSAHLYLDHKPLGDKLAGRHDYCVYVVCESSIANGWFFHDKPSFPAKCYLKVTTTTGREFRSELFVADEVFEEELGDDDSYTRRKLDYSKVRTAPTPKGSPPGTKD
jgi:hypothetical protein